MNIIKKYWDSVYVYILLLVPGLCMCAGTFWTICKILGLYTELQWAQIIAFDCSQIVYLSVALYFIYRNKKDATYISEHLIYVKGFIVLSLFVQYNFILYLFASSYVLECTFIFFLCIAFMFDSKLMILNTVLYSISFAMAHILRADAFLPMDRANVLEILAYRIMIFVLTVLCIVMIVYFVERFLMQARESNEENMHLMEKQLEYYKDMELLDAEIRKFRHDIKNHFICMESFFINAKTDELQKYFQDLQQSFSFERKIFYSGNDIIDAILHYDLPHRCREEVKVTVYGVLPEIRTVSAMDLCTLFSNLLSNAIASANQCVDKMEPQVAIHFASGNTYFSITISNSILSMHGKKEISKKKDRNHGHGLYKIRNVLGKYDGKIEQRIEEHKVTLIVYLPI